MSLPHTATWCTRLMIAVLLMAATPSDARVLPTGIGLRTGISGDGLATASTLNLHFSSYKWEWTLGLDMQYRQSHISGVQSTLYYYPMYTNVSGLRLGFFGNVRYNFSALMNKSVIAQETFLAPENKIDFSQLTLGTFEAQGGFAVRVSHSDMIRTFYGIGFGVYHTLGGKENYPLQHREFTHVQLVLDFGISLNIAKN